MWDKMASCAIAQKAARDPVPVSTQGRTAVIELPNEQAAALKAKAAAEGLSLEAWLNKLAARQESPPSRPHRHVADAIVENMRDIPPEAMATMPTDGASQHAHYMYGWPKKEA